MQIKNHRPIILIGICLIAFAACKQTQPPNDMSTVLSNGQWVIADITSDTATPPPTLFINTAVSFENGGLELTGPCNQIGGFYEVDEVGKVTKAAVHMTLMDCGSEAEQEVVLLRYFDESNHLSFDGDDLVMHSLQGRIHFRQAEAGDN